MSKRYVAVFIFIIVLVISLGGGYSYFIRKNRPQAASFAAGQWFQTSFTGGVWGTNVHGFDWGQADNWSAYYYKSRDLVFRSNNSFSVRNPSSLITSTYYPKDTNTSIETVSPTAGDVVSVEYRSGSSYDRMSDWLSQSAFDSLCKAERRYIQIRINFSAYQNVTNFQIKITQAFFNVSGTVYNNSTKSVISGAVISVGGYSAASSSSGSYTLTLPYQTSTSSFNLTASKDGFKNQPKNFTDSCGKGGNLNFELEPNPSDNPPVNPPVNPPGGGTNPPTDGGTNPPSGETPPQEGSPEDQGTQPGSTETTNQNGSAGGTQPQPSMTSPGQALKITKNPSTTPTTSKRTVSSKWMLAGLGALVAIAAFLIYIRRRRIFAGFKALIAPFHLKRVSHHPVGKPMSSTQPKPPAVRPVNLPLPPKPQPTQKPKVFPPKHSESVPLSQLGYSRMADKDKDPEDMELD